MGAHLGGYLPWPLSCQRSVELKTVIEGFPALAPAIEKAVLLIAEGGKVLARHIEEALKGLEKFQKKFPKIISELRNARENVKNALEEAEVYVSILAEFVSTCASSRQANKLADAYKRKEKDKFSEWLSNTASFITRTTNAYIACKKALENLDSDLCKAKVLCEAEHKLAKERRKRTRILGGSLSALSYVGAGAVAAATAVASVFTAGAAAPIGLGILSTLLASSGIAGTIATALKAGDFTNLIKTLDDLNIAISQMLVGAKELQDDLDRSQHLVAECDGIVNRSSFSYEWSEIVPKILLIGKLGDGLEKRISSSRSCLKVEATAVKKSLGK